MTTKRINSTSSKTFYSRFPSEIQSSLESGAYRSLCHHLRERSDEVQNIDMMSISGFCRNCLAKWLVAEARKLSVIFKQEQNNDIDDNTYEGLQTIISYLDSYGYDDAAQEVYGCEYSVWKKRHGKKASNTQLKLYAESVMIHAQHDGDTSKQSSTGNRKSQKLNNATIQNMLEAGAFRSLVNHLRDRSDEVQNIDLMTIAGFCRNCIAKWLVLEARKNSNIEYKDLLDEFGYDEAAEEVYGCSYPDWKKAHAKKATDRQMAKYKESEYMHAKHDMTYLSKKRPAVERNQPNKHRSILKQDNTKMSNSSIRSPLQSNVCCQDIDHLSSSQNKTTNLSSSRHVLETSNSIELTSKFKPPPPPQGPLSLTIGILTVSDRAASNEYLQGDLSGPKVEDSILSQIEMMNQNRISEQDANKSTSPSLLSCQVVSKAIVPDESENIQKYILTWSGKIDGRRGKRNNAVKRDKEFKSVSPLCDLIFTTGGTGFSSRDVTPEATLSILDRECRGLMSFCSAECSISQPLAALSRGYAGICGQSFVVNLPGNPNAIGQIIDILFPLLLHAVKDLKS